LALVAATGTEDLIKLGAISAKTVRGNKKQICSMPVTREEARLLETAFIVLGDLPLSMDTIAKGTTLQVTLGR
jgi:hypothetical protein